MSVNDLTPPDVHDDSPWRPGADVRFDQAPRRSFGRADDDRQDGVERAGWPPRGGRGLTQDAVTAPPPQPPVAIGHGRRWGGGLLVVALGIVSAVLVLQVGAAVPTGSVGVSASTSTVGEFVGSRSSALQDFGGDVILGSGDVPLLPTSQCPAQRLPSAVEPLWSTELPSVRRVVSPITISDDSVVAVVGADELTANGLPSVSIVALDAENGRERWQAPLQPTTGAHEIVGVSDGAVLVRSAAGPDMAYRRLFAFDEESGAVLWDRGFRGDWSATVDAESGRVYVGVRRPAVSTTEESEVAVLDSRSGDRLHIAAGSFVGLDLEGRLVTRVGDKLLATSATDRDLVGVVEPADSPYTVVGPRAVVADGNAAELSVFDGDGDRRRFPLVGSAGIDAPGSVSYLRALGDSALLVSGEGAVHGARVGDESVEIRWRVQGAMLDSVATDRGRSLLIGTEGGAQQRVVDGSTGRTIVNLEIRPGALTTLGLVANGVVMLDVVDGTSARAAFDLDGREMWALPGTGPLAVGRGLVVDITPDPAPDGVGIGVHLAAFGDPVDGESGATACRSVLTEWIPR